MPQTPPFNKFATLGFGLQTVIGTPVAVTNWFRKTSLSNFRPKIDKFRSKAAFGILDAQSSEIAMRTAEFSADFELTAAAAFLLAQHMTGGVPVAGVITPVNTDYLPYMPLQPLTFEGGAAGEYYKISDVNITKFKITWDSSGYMMGSIDAKGLVVADLGSLAAPTVPTAAFSRSHLNVNLAGVTPFLTEKFELELSVPIDFLEAATGTVLPAGFTRSGGDETFRELTISMSKHDIHTPSKAKYETTQATDTLVARMVQGANILEFNLPAFEYMTRDFPSGNGRVTTDIAGRATVSTNPFLVKNV
jgi:hypothetical protein